MDRLPLPLLLLISLWLPACHPQEETGALPDQQVSETRPVADPATGPTLFPDCFTTHPGCDTLSFRRGDTLDGLLRRARLPQEERSRLVVALRDVYDPGKFAIGAKVILHYLEPGYLLTLHHPLNFTDDLVIRRVEDRFTADIFQLEPSWKTRSVVATMDDSFFASFERQGESGNLATRVADLFSGEVDFFFDLRDDDRMEVLLATAVRPDRPTCRDRVLGARLVVAGRVHEAFLFPDEKGKRHYYHRDGSSLERRFLRAPLNFFRITDGFSHRRLHPVKKIYRPHYGVDYAAPIGTPILATADGTVISRNYQPDGAGRYLKIRHPGGIVTSYMHLSRYAKGSQAGRHVDKGQVIGYVGVTGSTTGPHVDYRIQVDGRYINPRNFESDSIEPLPPHRMEIFQERVDSLSGIWVELDSKCEPLPQEATDHHLGQQVELPGG